MVCAARKGKLLGREGKQQLLNTIKVKIDSRRRKDDKKWQAVLSKMNAEKKKKFVGVGNQGLKKSRVRGVTRRSQRPMTGRKEDTVAFDTTIHLSKMLQGKTFHKRAPLAIKKIKAFAGKMMKTNDNRIDGSLNNYIWHQGVKGVPCRVGVRIQRKVAEQQKECASVQRKRLYTVTSLVPVATFKGLLTKKAESA